VFVNRCGKEVPDDGSCESKHVAVCDRALKCFVGLHIFVSLFMIKKKTKRDVSE